MNTRDERERSLETGCTLLDRYVVDTRIGAGASSVVYSGRQLSTGQRVAIKVLRARALEAQEGDVHAARRFSRELQLTAKLSHPHIVRLIDAGTIGEDVVFTVFEYIEGASLAEVLKGEGSLAATEAKRFMLQALDALSAAHAAGIVHRDVKPTNIMITRRGAQRNLLLLDFGIATMVESARGEDFAAVTGSNSFPGTPAYAAPEQIRGLAPTPKSDLYAWGLVFLECLTGRRAMLGGSVADVLMSQLGSDPVPIPPALSHHPLAKILERATAKDVDLRYATAEDAFRELERCEVSELEPVETLEPLVTRSMRANVEPARTTSSSSPERRQVTALFVSFESTRASLEPEELAEKLRATRAQVEAMVASRGATLAPSRADQLLAYFGYPNAAEDAARRAVQVAVAIARATPGVAVAVHTGLVIVDPQASTADLVGETAAIAERAATLAHEGEAWITPATRRLVDSAFQLEARGEHTLRRGEAPTALAAVIAELDQQKRATRGPLIGRERELRLLQDRFEEMKAGVGQAALLIGEPGIGKSRLVEELRERIGAEPHSWLDARCVAERSDSPLHPFIELLSAQLDGGDLERWLSELGLPPAEVMPFFAALLSLPIEAQFTRPDLSARGIRERTMELVAAVFTQLAEKRPLVLVIEDLHWGDPSTLELVDRLISASRGTALFLVLTARPLARSPWTSTLLQIRLNRLSESETARLVAAIAPAGALDEESRSQIASRSDGVPLFVEELTLMVVESKDVVRALPFTLRDSLAARLDRLGEARRTALLASTFGREVEYALLREVSPLSEDELRRDLSRLLDAELLFQKGLVPSARYIFKHSLIQEAAYESLVKTSKKSIHKTIAETLELRFPDAVRTQPEVVAHHYAQAGNADDALKHIVVAGKRALSRSANQEAIAFVERGLGWVRGLDAGAQTTGELQLQAVLIPALFASKGYASPEVAKTLERSNELAARLGDTPHSFPIRWGIWVYDTVRGHHLRAVEKARHLLHIAEEAKHPDLIIEGHVALGHSLYYLPDLKEGSRHLEKVLELYDPARHANHAQIYGQDPALVAYAFLSSMDWLTGRCDRALELLGRGRALAKKLAHAYSTDFILGLSAVQYQLRREPSEALAAAGELLKSARAHVHPFWSAIGDILAGWAKVKLGDRSCAQISSGIEAFRATGARNNLPYDLALLAEAQAGTGDHDRALTTLDEAIAVYEETGERRLEAEIHRLRAESLRKKAGGWNDVAESWLYRAIDVARAHGARSLELRATLSLAEALAAQQKHGEACARLGAVYETLPEGHDTPDHLAARAMLAKFSAPVEERR